MSLKDRMAQFSEKTGFVKLVGRVLRPRDNRAAILAYHHLSANGNAVLPGLPVEMFYRQVSWLKRNCDVVPLSQLVTDLREGRDLSGKIVLTFDDGYASFFRYAFPILHAYHLPATLFVTTDFLDGQIPWYDKLRYILYETEERTFEFAVNGAVHRFALEDAAGRSRAYRELKRMLGSLPPQKRQTRLLDLQVVLQVEDFSPLVGATMNWEQLQLISWAGIEIGGHTVTHPSLSQISVEEQQREVMQCKRQLEQALNLPVRHFCYPTGKSDDFNVQVERIVADAGFESACSSEIGYVTPGDNSFSLKRLYTTEPYLAKFIWRLPQ